MLPQSKRFIKIFALTASFLFIALGILGYIFIEKQKERNVSSMSFNPVGWGSYRSNIYFFEFKYPPEYKDSSWSWQDSSFHFNTFNIPSTKNGIYVDVELIGAYCMSSLCDDPPESKLVLSDISWDYLGLKRYCDGGECDSWRYVYRSTYGDYRYYVRFDKEDQAQDILQTFRFLKNGRRPSPDFKTYTLDVRSVISRKSGLPVAGNLIISHNSVAIFPLDLGNQNRKLTEVGLDSIFEVQTKLSCRGSLPYDDPDFLKSINSLGTVRTKDVGNVRRITLVMPYLASQDNYIRVPSTFCIALHSRDGNRWTWSLPIKSILNDNLRQGRGEWVGVGVSNVDMIAILFDDTTVLETISFEVWKTSPEIGEIL